MNDNFMINSSSVYSAFTSDRYLWHVSKTSFIMLYVNCSIDELKGSFESLNDPIRTDFRKHADKRIQHVQADTKVSLHEMWNTYLVFVGREE